MAYYNTEMSGQPLANMEPLGTGNNSIQDRMQPNMAGYVETYLENVDLSVPLKFNSFDDVRVYLEKDRPAKKLLSDPSYPRFPEQQKMWVKAIVTAFFNLQGVIDGEKLLKQWDTMVSEDSPNIELMAWKFLKRVMMYHNLEGKLEPLNAETQKAKMWDSFADHMKCMLESFTTMKTLCRHLVSDNWTQAFIDAPELHSQRVVSNRKINNAKKRKADVGKAMVEQVKDMANDDGNGADKKEILVKIVSDYEADRADKRRKVMKQESRENSASGQTTRNKPNKKAAKPKAIQTGANVSNKLKSSNIGNDDRRDSGCFLGSFSSLDRYTEENSTALVPQQYSRNIGRSKTPYRVSSNDYTGLNEFNTGNAHLLQNRGQYGYSLGYYSQAPQWLNNATGTVNGNSSMYSDDGVVTPVSSIYDEPKSEPKDDPAAYKAVWDALMEEYPFDDSVAVSSPPQVEHQTGGYVTHPRAWYPTGSGY